jgi:hypothetical protein
MARIAFEILEGGFDFHELQIELPQLRRVGRGQVGAQQVAALARTHRLELGALELEVEVRTR